MSSIVHISEAASIAMHSMALLSARRESGPVSVKEMAEEINISSNHLSKVMQRLAKSGLVASRRGPSGGVTIAKDPNDISLLDVYEAVEGPLEPCECLLKERKCEPGNCMMGNLLTDISVNVKQHLSDTKLSKIDHVFAR